MVVVAKNTNILRGIIKTNGREQMKKRIAGKSGQNLFYYFPSFTLMDENGEFISV